MNSITDKQIKQTLIAAKEKISRKENHCLKVAAEDKNGNIVPSTDPSAFAFCAVGAIRSVTGVGESKYNLYHACIRKLRAFADKEDIIDTNYKGHERALKMFSDAIESFSS